MRRFIPLTILLALGCGQTPTDDPIVVIDDVETGPSEDTGLSDAGMLEADAGTDAGDEAGCGDDCPTIAWADGPALATARDHHMTALVEHDDGATLYVFGGLAPGSPPTIFGDVWSSPVGEDGSLGEWREATAMPIELGGTPVIQRGGRIYLISGRSMQDGNLALSQFTFAADLGPDGIVGDWERVEDFPEARFHHGGVATQTHVYVTGGLEINDATDTVHVGTFTANGGITWAEGPALPEPRTHHSSFLHAGHVYVLGGFGGGVASPFDLPNAHRAKIQEDGSLGAWEEAVSTLPSSRATHANAIYEGHVYVIGGIAPSGFTGEVLRAPLLDDGIGDWEVVEDATLPRVTGHTHHTPVYDGRVYLVSGGERFTLSPRSHVGTFNH